MMSADDAERMAGHLDELRRGGWRSGTGMTRPAEPDHPYPPDWRPPTPKERT